MPTLTEYFNDWSQPRFYNGNMIRPALIREYLRPDNMLSLELIIPPDWQSLYLQGQVQQGGRGNFPNRLPSALAEAILRLGFQARSDRNTHGRRVYTLRDHRFPLSIITYRVMVLPNIHAFRDRQYFRPNERFIHGLTLALDAWFEDNRIFQ